MSLAMPLPNKITLDSAKSTSFRVIVGQFGEGYQQVAPDGLNNKVDSWTITWGGLLASQVATVLNVLDESGAWGIITWTPFNESASKKFRMTKEGYTVATKNGNGIADISCNLVQVFDL